MATIRPIFADQQGWYQLSQNDKYLNRPCHHLRTFQDGVVGDIAQNGKDGNTYTDGWDSNAGGSTYSDEVLFNGKQVCKSFLPKGSDGALSLGGSVYKGLAVKRYETLIQRAILRFPAEFDFDESMPGGGAMKLLRQRVGDVGHVDVYINAPSNGYEGDFKFVCEVHTSAHDGNPHHAGPHNSNVTIAHAYAIPRDEWFEICFAVTYDNLSVDDGGYARAMIWVKDDLLIDITSIHTMNSGEETVNITHLCTYFNANNNPGQPDHGVTKDMWFYCAEYEISNLLQTYTDAIGNPKLPSRI
tara:strand:+ start:2850 stop:3749 length:900 start_codon:yes stop_codon:yes gene_type:complete